MNIFRGEIEVAIGGRNRLIKFGTNQLAIYTAKHKIDPSDVAFGMDQFRDLIWSGLVAGAKKKKQEVDFDEWDVGDWIDELSEEKLTEILEVFNNSMPSDEGDDSPKKK
jgi:hypothetical protein